MLIPPQSSPSQSETGISTYQTQAQNQELLSIIAELRNQNASIISENQTLRHELHILRKEFDVVRSEMQEAADILDGFSKEWYDLEVRYPFQECPTAPGTLK
jgi:regulator of replication initiation timing